MQEDMGKYGKLGNIVEHTGKLGKYGEIRKHAETFEHILECGHMGSYGLSKKRENRGKTGNLGKCKGICETRMRKNKKNEA